MREGQSSLGHRAGDQTATGQWQKPCTLAHSCVPVGHLHAGLIQCGCDVEMRQGQESG